ncbi:fertilization-influencing membrane protein isoform X1 [Tamandua tetradactyla]|uniref:fertilization-influencing membrane protein isoform X1 n=1 Tax=Tamandua tetradactyla TaxID=48850 RepID=UPI004053B131
MTSQSPPAGGLMTLWQGVLVWLAGLGAIETAPGPPPGSAQTTGSGAEAWLFLDTPDFFDYADSDEARLLAVSEFIGEEPVTFVNSVLHPHDLPERRLRSQTWAPTQLPSTQTRSLRNESPVFSFPGLSGASWGSCPFLW